MNNKPQPSLQNALVAGLNLLNDPEVRMPASQAEGIVSLRALLQGLATGQLVVAEPPAPVADANAPVPTPKARAPRRTKAEMAAHKAANGAAGPATVAAQPLTQ